MSVTPNMNLRLPTPSTTVGPTWASDLTTALSVVDDHDHSSGKGRKITPSGIDINETLDMQNQNITNVNTAKLKNQVATLNGVSFACTVQFVNGNFVIVNGGGTEVQITNGNTIVSSVVVAGNPLMPAGAVLDFAGSTIPIGFLNCNGAAVSRTTFSDLFNAIGTVYGVGDGTTTFNLPNFNGRTSVGGGTYTDTVLGSVTRSVGQNYGAASHVLTEAQMPRHTHIQNAHNHSVPQLGVRGFADNATGGYYPTYVSDVTGSTIATNKYTGGLGVAESASAGDTHNIMQPSLAINKMIKT